MLGVFATVAAFGFVVATIVPTGLRVAEADAAQEPVSLYADAVGDAQTLLVAGVVGETAPKSLDRGNYIVYVTPTPTPEPVVIAEPASFDDGGSNTADDGDTGDDGDAGDDGSSSSWAPPFVNPDPGTAQAIALQMVRDRGWGDGEFSCLVSLWNRESGWRVNAYNAGSGAYGIPQSLPGNKMASAGSDWESNPATQISWGLGYIGGRYGSPCGAWSHSESYGWY